ncbi:DNA gyrase subunit A [Ectocarpus siliculosus]|uniref:DNA topoisomerase (ATP-hydrolyzing) n=1 Tax=Ectocarpus siliculosus TaxID=2880 RepID=D8LPZ0_ECTSI|nr:DNA gyrase subunit A [Ectocarpus siliculosus]|eukprot:CBN74882.1 DNA gyrase subunit A [Ectocarpus siliculosus]
MKPARHKVSRQQRRRRWMTARVGNAAAVLAAAWSLPHRCCQALRAPCSSSAISGAGYQYRSYVGTAAQRASRTTARLSGGFVPGGAGRRKVVAAAESRRFISNGGGFVGDSSRLVAQQRRAPAAGAVRMASGGGSDESQFFTDPDAPSEVDGVGPPGPLVGGDQVVNVGLEAEIKTSFMQYAMSIILGRALPDVRDGLKPVHRRILYAMYGLNLNPEGTHRKCARVVGEVLGKYHPHGDTAVYDALVRMAQDFVMSAPLIQGHGNFGSIDNDPAAAMRYTECKLSSVAKDTLLTDINLDTVDMMTNFDGNEKEPVVLPSRLPLLLINGATGIAVGMATNIPPHNLGEVVAATIALIRNPGIPDDQLFRLLPAPDFPTGGRIMGLAGARKLYTTSNGGVTLRATTHIEVIEAKGRTKRNAVVVTELPYQVNKSSLLQRMAEMVNDKKLEGISDLRDESDRDGVRVVVELKRDANPQVVENNLFKKTQLQTSFSGNMLALGSDGTKPHRFSLRAAIQSFVDFRFTTVRRRTAFELGKVRAREHIVQGMLQALGMIDAVIELVRASTDTPMARDGLMAEPYGLSQEQADAILALRLGRLTSMEEGKLKAEAEDLKAAMERLEGVMNEDSKVMDIIVEELTEAKNKHAVPRRTMIKPDEGELHEEDLLANDNSVVVVTAAGYIKRMPLEEFTAQNRGTRGKAGAKMSSDHDVVQHFFTCQDHDTILFVSDKGVAYGIRAFQVPVGSRTAKGVPVPQVLPIAGDEQIASVLAVDDFREDEYLVLLTQKGYIKRTPLAAFKSTSSRGLIIISLGEDDTLRWVKRCCDENGIVIGSKQGYATRFLANQKDLRPSGRTSRGVKEEGHSLLVLTTRGYGKRVALNEFKTTRRGGKGVIALKLRQKLEDTLACFRIVGADDEIMLSTAQGTIVRQRAGAIARQSRTATGVIVQKLDANDGIKDVALVPEISEDAAAATGRPGASSGDDVGAGSGDAGGVAEALRGGGGDDEYAEEEEGLGFGREELAWMSSIVRDVPENVR